MEKEEAEIQRQVKQKGMNDRGSRKEREIRSPSS